MFKKYNRCSVFCPNYNEYNYLLYLKKTNFFKKVLFKSNYFKENNYSEFNIIDIQYIDLFCKDIKINNSNKNFLLFLWNGEKHYTQFSKQINFLKKKLNKKLHIFFTGNATSKKNILFFDDIFYKKNLSNLRFSNCYGIRFFTKLRFFFPWVYSVVFFIKDLPKTLNIFNKKICFTGLVNVQQIHLIDWKQKYKLKDHSIIFLKNLDFHNDKNLELHDKIIRIGNKYLFSKKFNKLSVSSRYFIVQLFFRKIFLLLLSQSNLFFYQDWGDKRNFINTFFYKNLIHLDLGSTVGNNVSYVRNFILSNFKKKILKINIFSKIDLNNKVSFLKQTDKMFKYLRCLMSRDIKNMNLKDLIRVISANNQKY
jgi:hypothetical protein